MQAGRPNEQPIYSLMSMGGRVVKGFIQGILKGEVSLYHWLPVWPVWNQLY